MYIVVGGTGHVGSAVAKSLLKDGEPVTIVTRSANKVDAWRGLGAEVALADVHDIAAMREVFRQGKRAFLLNPPADTSGNTDLEERRTVHCLLEALEGSGLEKVVAQSAIGARPGEECGDLTVLYGLEVGLKNQSVPACIIRAGYYYSNWDAMMEPARKNGVLSTMLPADRKIPMVAPADLGRVAARLLREPADQTGLYPVEGPERCSPNDVAAGLAAVLARSVRVEEIPRAAWESTFRGMGFSDAAARSYARMTAATVDSADFPDNPIRGTISLLTYLESIQGQA